MKTLLLCIELDKTVNWTDIISLSFVVIGGLFAFLQWRNSLKLKRAEYVKSLLDEIKTNKNIVNYLFDYDAEKWYGPSFHNSGELERKIDTTLDFYSYICYLHNHCIIKQSDFNCFKYDIERIITNHQFIDYSYNLYHFSQKINQPLSFYELFQYAKKRDCFDDEFWNSRSTKYPHYLNF